MTTRRLLRWTSIVTLATLILYGFSTLQAQPRSGDWKAPTGFGELEFTVNSAGTHINKLIFRFSNWTCGPVTWGGGSVTTTWPPGGGIPISNNQFTYETYFDIGSTKNQKMTVSGTFNQTGDLASGTWVAVNYGVTCSGSWGPVGLSEKDYYLAQVANGNYGSGSFRMTFVLFNTNNVSVTARLRLSSDSGGPLTLTIPGLGTGSDFNIPLAAGGTVIYQTDGTGSLVVGAAHVSCPQSIGVSAIFSIYDPQGRFQTEAGVGNSEAMTDFFIPVDSTGTFNTGLALYNPGQADAALTLRLINPSGQETRQATRNLAAGNHTAQFVSGTGQLFPDVSNFQGILRVTASVPVSAIGLRQNDPPLSYTSIPAVPRSSTRTSFNLAHVANGSFGTGSFKTSFLLFNISSSNASATITLTRDNGQALPVTIPGRGTNSVFSIQLASGGSTFLQTDGSGALLSGAATITSNVPLGAAAIFTVFDSQGRFQTEAGVGDSSALTEMRLPVDVTGSFNSGVAFFVPGNAPATLTMRLLNADGSVKATAAAPLVLSAKNHTAQFVTQLFPGTADFRGSLAITASAGTAALTLRQNDSPLSYTTLPVVQGAAP